MPLISCDCRDVMIFQVHSSSSSQSKVGILIKQENEKRISTEKWVAIHIFNSFSWCLPELFQTQLWTTPYTFRHPLYINSDHLEVSSSVTPIFWTERCLSPFGSLPRALLKPLMSNYYKTNNQIIKQSNQWKSLILQSSIPLNWINM